MKKIMLILSSVLAMSVLLVACSSNNEKVVTKVEHTTIKTYASNHKVIIKTFGNDSTVDDSYNALDKKVGDYLSRIKNINDFDVKITSGAYSDDNSFNVLSGGGVNSYNNYRYMTVLLIKKS